MSKPVGEKTWEEFKDTGLLWFINSILHTFGWAITVETDTASKITRVYPARTTMRGFDQDMEDNCRKQLSKYMAEMSEDNHKAAYPEDG